MKTYYLLFCFFLLAACTLNSEQEKALNAAITRYISARNEGKVAIVVACTYPPAVAHYTEAGDSIFRAHYDLSNLEALPFYRDGSQAERAADDQRIQVKYIYKQADMDYGAYSGDEKVIIALSKNEGKTWFFLDEEDYWNDAIVKPTERLLSK